MLRKIVLTLSTPLQRKRICPLEENNRFSLRPAMIHYISMYPSLRKNYQKLRRLEAKNGLQKQGSNWRAGKNVGTIGKQTPAMMV